MHRGRYRAMFGSVAALISSQICAATLTWNALDFSRCIHWSLTDEASMAARQEMKPLLTKRGQEWFSVEPWNLTESRSYAGICKRTGDQLDRIDCLSGDTPGFPLAGTTFVVINRTTSGLPTYKCTAGCAADAVTILYEMPYEDGENADLKKAYRRFRKQCPKAN